MFIDAQTRNAHCEANHNANHSMVKLQTKTKQNQAKRKLKQQAHKYRTGVTNSQSIDKLHRWNERFAKWPVADLAPSHTIRSLNILYFMILRISR